MFIESKNKITKFTNCCIIRNDKIVKDDLWVRDGIIIDPEPIFYQEKIQCDYVVDCNSTILIPGFIDIQINGGYGYDFSSDGDRITEALSVVRKKVLSSGVTSFCPTLVTSPGEIYHKVLPQIKRCRGDLSGASILGVHLEGPFISPEKKGAHPVQYIQEFTEGFESLQNIYGDLSQVCMITLAPELARSDQVINSLSERGIIVSLGHSTADITEGERAVLAGASFVTHLFNAMLPFHHRDPGLVGLLASQFIEQPIYYGIIADGIHTHPAALRIAHKTLPQGLVLVTDAMAALGLGEGSHQIGQMSVQVTGRRAFIRGTETLAGSIAPMDECVRRFRKAADVNLVEAVKAATLHPAKALGIANKKGSLDFGCDADFLLIDDNPLQVRHTFIAGQCVFSSPESSPIKYVCR